MKKVKIIIIASIFFPVICVFVLYYSLNYMDIPQYNVEYDAKDCLGTIMTFHAQEFKR